MKKKNNHMASTLSAGKNLNVSQKLNINTLISRPTLNKNSEKNSSFTRQGGYQCCYPRVGKCK